MLYDVTWVLYMIMTMLSYDVTWALHKCKLHMCDNPEQNYIILYACFQGMQMQKQSYKANTCKHCHMCLSFVYAINFAAGDSHDT